MIAWIGNQCGRVLRPFVLVFQHLYGAIADAYPVLLMRAIRRPGTTLSIGGGVFVVALAVVPYLGVDLLPAMQQSELTIGIALPPGVSLQETSRVAADIAKVAAKDQVVEHVGVIVGDTSWATQQADGRGENTARIRLRFAANVSAGDRRELVDRLVDQGQRHPEVTISRDDDVIVQLRQPVEVEIFGEDLGDLELASAAVTAQLRDVAGVRDVKSSWSHGAHEVQVVFDHNQLAHFGLDLDQAASRVRQQIAGEIATTIPINNRDVDVRVRAKQERTHAIEQLPNLVVGTREDRAILLKSVASISHQRGPAEIRRIGQQRAVAVSADTEGGDLKTITAAVRTSLRDIDVPPGVTIKVAGQSDEMKRSLASLVLALSLAAFLVYAVLAAQFESLLQPFVVVLTLPLAAVGSIAALAVTGRAIDVTSLIGMTMLAGIVVNNAIVLVDAINDQRRQGVQWPEDVMIGSQSRLRPILMTTATTVVALIPMIVGHGGAAAFRQSLAITVIGGLLASTALTLLVIPAAYTALARFARPARGPSAP